MILIVSVWALVAFNIHYCAKTIAVFSGRTETQTIIGFHRDEEKENPPHFIKKERNLYTLGIDYFCVRACGISRSHFAQLEGSLLNLLGEETEGARRSPPRTIVKSAPERTGGYFPPVQAPTSLPSSPFGQSDLRRRNTHRKSRRELPFGREPACTLSRSEDFLTNFIVGKCIFERGSGKVYGWKFFLLKLPEL